MPKLGRSRLQRNRPDDASEEGASTFAWEFDADNHSGQHSTALPPAVGGTMATSRTSTRDERVPDAHGGHRFARAQRLSGKGAEATKRAATSATLPAGSLGPSPANYVRDRLDRALDRWWAVGELPPLALLRDGLRLLESGGTVSESHRTLLLRAALAYDRGVQTALRHQADVERVALILAEALVEWEPPLDAERLPQIVGHDAKTIALLIAELERSRILLTGDSRRRAQSALEQLSHNTRKAAKVQPAPAVVLSRQRPIRQIILILLLVAFLGFVLWQQRRNTPAGMVDMPAATYAILRADLSDTADGVALDAFFIDRFEVTNREYRICVEHGACPWPKRTHSATRSDYFMNPAFNDFPVVNVSQVMASSYCTWQDKRLPSAAEWQAAASVSTTTGQAYPYPWGATFEPQRTNSAASGQGDTVAIGTFRPAGDSPSGVADMAGNVAEWTATLVPGADQVAQAVVKGGSYAGGGDALYVGAELLFSVEQSSPQIGFRCARSRLIAPS